MVHFKNFWEINYSIVGQRDKKEREAYKRDTRPNRQIQNRAACELGSGSSSSMELGGAPAYDGGGGGGAVGLIC